MKNFKLILFAIFLFFSHFFFVSAKEVMTCDYKAVFTYNSDQLPTYVKIKATVFDDGSFKVAYDDGTSILAELRDGRNVVDMPLFNDLGEAGNFPMVEFNNNFELYNNSCPYAMTMIDGTSFFIQFVESSEYCDNGGTYCTKATEKREEEAPKPTVKLVQSCVKSVTTDNVSMGSGVEFKFQTYSNGSKEFCGRVKNTSEYRCTTAINNNLMAISISDPMSKGDNTYVVNPDEIFLSYGPTLSDFNASMEDKFIDSLKFTCPQNIYLIHKSLQEQQWELTTSKEKADEWGNNSNELNNGSLKENGDGDDTPNSGPLHVPIGDSTNISDGGNCNSIVTGEFQKWLKGLFSLIRIASIVLIIVLTGMDGIKSFASFEDKNSKSFYKRLLIRLICLAIIFLAPSIIEIFIDIASANDNIKNIVANPFCGLFN